MPPFVSENATQPLEVWPYWQPFAFGPPSTVHPSVKSEPLALTTLTCSVVPAVL